MPSNLPSMEEMVPPMQKGVHGASFDASRTNGIIFFCAVQRGCCAQQPRLSGPDIGEHNLSRTAHSDLVKVFTVRGVLGGAQWHAFAGVPPALQPWRGTPAGPGGSWRRRCRARPALGRRRPGPGRSARPPPAAPHTQPCRAAWAVSGRPAVQPLHAVQWTIIEFSYNDKIYIYQVNLQRKMHYCF